MSRIFEKQKALVSFVIGIVLISIGFIILGLSVLTVGSLVFLGVFVFAVGEMVSSPRIQEYILWIAPKEKAGLYMGANFLATFIGAMFSGIYTWLMGRFEAAGNPQNIMFTLAVHTLLGIVAIYFFTKKLGSFKERVE